MATILYFKYVAYFPGVHIQWTRRIKHQHLLTDGFPIFEWAPGVTILDDKQQVPEDLE